MTDLHRIARLALPAAAIALGLARVAPAQVDAPDAADAPERPAAAPASAPKAAPPQYLGTVQSNAVYVRAGAGEDRTPLVKLDRGASVVTVGLEGDWLKILPPEGTYLTFPKASVERRGGGDVGRVVKQGYARFGSAITKQAYDPAATLVPGADVRIVGGNDDSWYIAPPAGVYAYIRRQDVAPGERVSVVEQAGGGLKIVPYRPEQQSAMVPPKRPETEEFHPGASPPRTVQSAPATRPASQPVDSAVVAQLKQAETQFMSASTRPIGEQPIDAMMGEYRKIADASPEKSPTRQIANYRLEVLKSRRDAQQELNAAMAAQQQGATTRQALGAEGQELQQRAAASNVEVYAAVGELRASSLQLGDRPLYRLTDPANGRTVVYVRSADPHLASMSGQFVGVRGDLVDDTRMNLKYVNADAVEPVEAAAVYKTVAARLAPASLAAAAGQ